MKNKILRTAAFLVLLAMVSCTKSPEEEIEKNSVYLSLEVGNYWVYHHFQIDESGSETLLSQVDSIFIQRDTLIRDHRYLIMEGHNYPYSQTWVVRDSLKYLVNHKGEILFSETNFSDVLHSVYEVHQDDTLVSILYKMQQPNQQISVPAGTFNVLNYMGEITKYYSEESIESQQDNYYAPNIGRILASYEYYSSPVRIEKRLSHFYVHSK